MKQNLSKAEMVFRVSTGIIIIVALYFPQNIMIWIFWILLTVLIISGIVRYCPLCRIVDKNMPKEQ